MESGWSCKSFLNGSQYGNAKNAKGGIVVTSNEVAKGVVDVALKVHRALGPGLLESAYQACIAHELGSRHYQVENEVPLPLEFEK